MCTFFLNGDFSDPDQVVAGLFGTPVRVRECAVEEHRMPKCPDGVRNHALAKTGGAMSTA